MRNPLFEDPFWLYVAFGFAEVILLPAWLRWRSSKLAWALLMPPVLAVGAGVTAWTVTTDRERIVVRLADLASAFECGRYAEVAEMLAPEYQDVQHGYAAALHRVFVVMNTYKIERVKVKVYNVDVSGDEATSMLTATATAAAPYGPTTVEMTWTLWWVRKPVGWRVTSAHMNEPGWDASP